MKSILKASLLLASVFFVLDASAEIGGVHESTSSRPYWTTSNGSVNFNSNLVPNFTRLSVPVRRVSNVVSGRVVTPVVELKEGHVNTDVKQDIPNFTRFFIPGEDSKKAAVVKVPQVKQVAVRKSPRSWTRRIMRRNSRSGRPQVYNIYMESMLRKYTNLEAIKEVTGE